jgi:hypothetical protein
VASASGSGTKLRESADASSEHEEHVPPIDGLAEPSQEAAEEGGEENMGGGGVVFAPDKPLASSDKPSSPVKKQAMIKTTLPPEVRLASSRSRPKRTTHAVFNLHRRRLRLVEGQGRGALLCDPRCAVWASPCPRNRGWRAFPPNARMGKPVPPPPRLSAHRQTDPLTAAEMPRTAARFLGAKATARYHAATVEGPGASSGGSLPGEVRAKTHDRPPCCARCPDTQRFPPLSCTEESLTRSPSSSFSRTARWSDSSRCRPRL